MTEKPSMRWLSTARSVEEHATTHAQQQTETTEGKNYVYRITPSPRQMKTQIARVSYAPSRRRHNASPRRHVSQSPSNMAASATQTPHSEMVEESLSPDMLERQTITTTTTAVETSRVQQEFDRKKQERQKEIEVIQNMLSEIGKSPHKLLPDTEADVEAIAVEAATTSSEVVVATTLHTFRRSNTELTFVKRPKAASTRRSLVRHFTVPTRSRSSQPPPTRSSELLSTARTAKKCSYNPEEARRFMEEQKRRRAPLEQMNREKSALEKEQIKKRLEELRKNTREIVNKNLKKKRPEMVGGGADTPIASPSNATIIFKQPPNKPNSKRQPTPLPEGHNDALSLAAPLIARSDQPAAVSSQSPLMENQKRVGLLRKPETKDHSFRAIDDFSIDKENVALDMLTERYNLPIEARVKDSCSGVEVVHTAPDVNCDALPRKQSADVIPKERHSKSVGVQLSATYRTQKSWREKSVQVEEEKPAAPVAPAESNNTADAKVLPFWLKPSAVQVYPYNFIMAVRRKLDAMSYPPTQQLQHAAKAKHQTTSTRELHWPQVAEETPLSRATAKETRAEVPQPHAKRRIITADELRTTSALQPCASHSSNKGANAFCELPEKTPLAPTAPSRESLSRTHTLSDMGSSNFSSISLQLPVSNTVSEVSSLRSECVRGDAAGARHQSQAPGEDDSATTVSSSIFNSPRKRTAKGGALRPVSPLSLERIENLRITRKQMTAPSATHAASAASSEIAEELPPEELKSVGMDFNRLLSDFNRSLSKVIEVNAALKQTLDKTPPLSGSSVEYSNDFEPLSATNATHLAALSPPATAALVQGRSALLGHRLEQRKRNLQQIASEVQPLLTSTETAPASKVMPPLSGRSTMSAAQLQLNLESNSDNATGVSSSSNSSVVATQSPSVEVVSPQNFEKRLQLLVDMKANLRQTIHSAAANRATQAGQPEAVEQLDTLQMPPLSLQLKRTGGSLNLKRATADSAASSASAELEADAYASDSRQFEATASSASNDNSNGPTAVQSATKSSPGAGGSAEAKELASKTSSIEEELEFTMQPCSTHDNNNSGGGGSGGGSGSGSGSRGGNVPAAFLRGHVTSERGDFLPLRQDAAGRANATQLQAVITAAALEATKEEQAPLGEEADSGSVASMAPPSYQTEAPAHSAHTPKWQQSPRRRSISSEIAAIFSSSDLQLTLRSAEHTEDDGSVAESTHNYSSVGLYEQLIQTETTKTEQLTTLLRLREKALLDRTKGQIALLELQKERYKAKGWLQQISAIKKKQRGILLKMAKEREEIKRLLQSTTTTSNTSTAHSSARPLASDGATATTKEQQSPLLALPFAVPLRRRPPSNKGNALSAPATAAVTTTTPRAVRSAPIVRANYELETSRPLEELLQRREADLRRRREHVERLMRWHRRLDEEEAAVQQLERQLFACSNAHAQPRTPTNTASSNSKSNNKDSKPRTTSATASPSAALKMERRLREIDRSLRELSSISNSSSSLANHEEHADGGETPADCVRTTGSKLNKLWRRLTSQTAERYEPARRYKVCQADIERLYEEAKLAVLRDLAQNEQCLPAELLERSSASPLHSSAGGDASPLTNGHAAPEDAADIVVVVENVSVGVDVPQLQLNSSSGHSEEAESFVAEELSAHSFSQGNYSPSAAEENFKQQPQQDSSNNTNNNNSSCSSASSEESSAAGGGGAAKLNIRKFLAHAQQLLSAGSGRGASQLALQRSHSDTEISERLTKGDSADFSSSGRTPLSAAIHTASTGGSAKESASVDDSSAVDVATLPQPSAPTEQEEEEPDEGTIATGSETRASSVIRSVSEEQASAEDSIANSIPSSIATNLASPDSVPGIPHTSSTHSAPFPSDSESKARAISAKLDEISAAVLELSQSNALPTYQSTKTTTTTNTATNSDATAVSPAANDSLDASYSGNFEGPLLSTELHSSPSVLDTPPSIAAEQTPNATTTTITPSSSMDGSALQSRTFTKATQPHSQISLENRILEIYEADFESADETCIDDLSLPQFETTVETTQEIEEAEEEVKAPQAKVAIAAPPPPPPPPPPPSSLPTATSHSCAAQLMPPDIISELDIRRCQQSTVENEQPKQYEHVTAVPYYFREIPNKPPPPYVPPAHGSPMTTIFPSVERIRDITYRRTHELYCELLKTDYTNEQGEALPSVMAEKITNIYERIILDVCREYLEEHREVLSLGDPTNFHSQLAFFNPPDRLRCIQESVYKEVRRCLAMDKTPPKRTQVYSVYGQRARRDHIGKIIIQEMYDEDDRWCNFHREENEVLDLIVEEMFVHNIRELAKEVLLAEGGTIDNSSESSGELTDRIALEEGDESLDAEACAPNNETATDQFETVTRGESPNSTKESLAVKMETSETVHCSD